MKKNKTKQKRLIIFIIGLIVVVSVEAIVLISKIIHEYKFNDQKQNEITVFNEQNKEFQADIKKLTDANTSLQAEVKKLTDENSNIKKEAVNNMEEISNLVVVTDVIPNVTIDLRYATDNNFTGKKMYPVSVCLLRKETADKLKKANDEFLKKGYHIKIWDAYRPLSIQQIMWNVKKDDRYVADPSTGSVHNRGAAVDITLVDGNGKELPMPSGFDEFSSKAFRSSKVMSKEQKQNMDYMTSVMASCGFSGIDTEWWHFEDNDCKNYPIQNIKLEYFSK